MISIYKQQQCSERKKIASGENRHNFVLRLRMGEQVNKACSARWRFQQRTCCKVPFGGGDTRSRFLDSSCCVVGSGLPRSELECESAGEVDAVIPGQEVFKVGAPGASSRCSTSTQKREEEESGHKVKTTAARGVCGSPVWREPVSDIQMILLSMERVSTCAPFTAAIHTLSFFATHWCS